MTNKLISLSPTDITIQIIPEFLKNSEKIELPDNNTGYIFTTKKFIVDQIENEFCGLFEIVTIYFNDKIRRDLLEELYSGGLHFDIYVKQNSSKDCPRILRLYKDCSMCRQEFIIPEVGLNTHIRYYFTNSNEPWQLSEEKIKALTPVNQYIYDYAVSKAIKNLQYSVEDVKKSIEFAYQVVNNNVSNH